MCLQCAAGRAARRAARTTLRRPPLTPPAVTDFGASDKTSPRGRPAASASSTTETIAVTEPATSAASIGRIAAATALRLSQSGTASATVAGPSRKGPNRAPPQQGAYDDP